MELTAILGICIIATALATLLKNYKSEYALIVALLAGGVVLFSLMADIYRLFQTLRSSIAEMGLDTSYFPILLKALGICVITGFVADMCRDSGQSSLASKAELAGRCAIFVLSVPLLLSILKTAGKLIG
ncbi:MAG: stage III sporulation AC/AD family protein [Acutalibacteraceae bacterium]|nr:stage III sporulation AC/AD family protein [Acutalibacteraceae bacterium]